MILKKTALNLTCAFKYRWAIKARVTIKSKPYYQERYEGNELVQGKKCFFVMLEDGSGKNIKARACSCKLFNKFYSKFQVSFFFSKLCIINA
jgi:hypothetical protein